MPDRDDLPALREPDARGRAGAGHRVRHGEHVRHRAGRQESAGARRGAVRPERAPVGAVDEVARAVAAARPDDGAVGAGDRSAAHAAGGERGDDLRGAVGRVEVEDRAVAAVLEILVLEDDAAAVRRSVDVDHRRADGIALEGDRDLVQIRRGGVREERARAADVARGDGVELAVHGPAGGGREDALEAVFARRDGQVIVVQAVPLGLEASAVLRRHRERLAGHERGDDVRGIVRQRGGERDEPGPPGLVRERKRYAHAGLRGQGGKGERGDRRTCSRERGSHEVSLSERGVPGQGENIALFLK